MKQPHNIPDYKKIFRDILEMKYPDKQQECQGILAKKELSAGYHPAQSENIQYKGFGTYNGKPKAQILF